MENTPKKKVRCTFHEFESDLGENQELGINCEVGIVSGLEENQEMNDSVTEKIAVFNVGSGFSDRKIENFGQEMQEAQNVDIGFVADTANDVKERVFSGLVDREERDFVKSEVGLSGIQEFDKPTGEFTGSYKAIEQEKSLLEVEMGPAIEGEYKETSDFEENEDILMGKEMESESLLEAKKKRLLAELEVGRIFEGKTNVEKVIGFATFLQIDEKVTGCQEAHKMVQNNGQKIDSLKGSDVPVRRPLKIEVIDDTALIETVPVPKAGNSCLKDAEVLGSAKAMERNHKNDGEKEVDGKRAKRRRRKGKGKDLKMVLETHDRHKNLTHVMEVHYGGQKNGDQSKKMYSREELEALRFAKIVEQRKLWKDIYTGLGLTVMSEYNDLASSKHQKNIRLNLDPPEHFARKEEAPAMLREDCSENVDNELEYIKDYERENVNLLDPACGQNITGEDAYMVIEEEYSEDGDSDEEYNSILRPAFLVEGEPDFDNGPPEDGLEYLRRVRWEAAQIPKVKVAKLDRSKYDKEQSVYMPRIPEIAKCLEHLLPLKQWEDAFLADFSELRLFLSHLEGSSSKISCKMLPIFTADEENDFCQLPEDIIIEKFNNLNTNEVHSYNPPDGSSQKNSTDQPYMNAEDNEISSSYQNSNPRTSVGDSSGDCPTLSVIRRMDSVARVSMLRKRISSVETVSTLSRNDCVWLFALCAAVDTPLEADTCASLRSLLRKCASLRAGKSEVDEEVIMLNILVTISGRYFGQLET